MTGGAASAGVVTVFGSGVCAPDSAEYLDAEILGQLLAEAGFAVCNGGYGGTMAAAARGAHAGGGRTIGVVLESISDPPNSDIDEVIRARDLPDRLRELLRRGEAYVALPGGTGTLAELALALEFNRKGGASPAKPVVLLGDYWRPAIENAGDLAGASGSSKLFVAASPGEAVEILKRELGR